MNLLASLSLGNVALLGRRLASLVCLGVMLATSGCGRQEGNETASREDWPTEEEAKAAIFKVEHAIHASETNKSVWKVKDMTHEVKSVKFAEKTAERQMNYGASAITVFPAKILYTRVTTYEHKDATREEQGADGVWFLYKDSFGEWTGKYGSE